MITTDWARKYDCSDVHFVMFFLLLFFLFCFVCRYWVRFSSLLICCFNKVLHFHTVHFQHVYVFEISQNVFVKHGDTELLSFFLNHELTQNVNFSWI